MIEHIITGLHESVVKQGHVDLTSAQKIAEGGTHLLYRFPDNPFVIKVMKQNPNPQELEALEKKYATLYASFDQEGKERCIKEKHLTLPILLPGAEPQMMAISVVPFEPCFHAQVKFDFKIEPVELDPYVVEHHPKLCGLAVSAFINCEEVNFPLNDYARVDERMGAILQRLDEDPQLREVMKEFLTHYRDFYQKTNIILDAMGHENILFFKDKAGDWQFKIGSVIKHDTGKYTQELFSALDSGQKVDLTTFVNFTHAYFSPANIRALNVCAKKLGLDPIIHDININPQVVLNLTHTLPVGERMLAYAKHGDFAEVTKILSQSANELTFNIKDFWAYSQIADQYTKHQQPPQALKNFLDQVSALPVVLPENAIDAKRMLTAKEELIARKNAHDKMMLTSPTPALETIVPHYKVQLQKAKSSEPVQEEQALCLN